jgi:hypothetical protein|tara:strand:+ start:404 stop:589 length:186 start_codon:yes stop_codon:yes gene_type:complete
MAAILHIIEMAWKCVYNKELATEVIREISFDTYYKAKLLVVTSLQQRATLYEVSFNILKLS